jgi:prepilin-type N-terminal cleavage/methylation domain-containing protein
MNTGVAPGIRTPGASAIDQRHPSTAGAAAIERGFTLIELLFVVSIVATLTAMAIPATRDAIDELRAAMAARSLSSRLMYARIDAVKRSAAVALRFEPFGDDYRMTTVLDGNGNGIRTTEIQSGVDVPLTMGMTLKEQFPGIRFGLLPGVPDADGNSTTDPDGVRIGSARILTMSSDGTATAGTLYLHGRRSQFAVRILGATGRVRVLQFHQGTHTWRTR